MKINAKKKAVKIANKIVMNLIIHLDPINGHFHSQLDHIKSRHQNKSSCVFNIFKPDAVGRYTYIHFNMIECGF